MKFEDLPRGEDGTIDPEQVEWPVVITLARPMEIAGETVERIEMR